jgi:L-fucose isomerase-like protein
MTQPESHTTLGLIVGNRGFFPDHLVETGRKEMIAVLERAGSHTIVLDEDRTKYGAVETYADAQACADLFKSHAATIEGVIVSLPNFGDERAIADTLRLARLDVPVLIQATPDTWDRLSIEDRRDSFCGKMSACNNLLQYGIPHSLTTLHTESPDSDEFAADLEWFVAVCKVVRGFRNLRVGAIGARPAAFNTVRFSEKLLEASGITIETVDLSEIFGRVDRLSEDDPAVKTKLEAIRSYVLVGNTPAGALVKQAKLGVVIERWMMESNVSVTALQCWTALETYFGVVPCTLMSMMSNQLMSSACEVDICGALAMHALRLASGTPSALLDWNNNYRDDPDKAVCFHCGNLPKHFFAAARMDYQAIIAGTVGKENTFGTLAGRIKSGPVTFARLSTDDGAGRIAGYVGAGAFTDDPLDTFGSACPRWPAQCMKPRPSTWGGRCTGTVVVELHSVPRRVVHGIELGHGTAT